MSFSVLALKRVVVVDMVMVMPSLFCVSVDLILSVAIIMLLNRWWSLIQLRNGVIQIYTWSICDGFPKVHHEPLMNFLARLSEKSSRTTTRNNFIFPAFGAIV